MNMQTSGILLTLAAVVGACCFSAIVVLMFLAPGRMSLVPLLVIGLALSGTAIGYLLFKADKS